MLVVVSFASLEAVAAVLAIGRFHGAMRFVCGQNGQMFLFVLHIISVRRRKTKSIICLLERYKNFFEQSPSFVQCFAASLNQMSTAKFCGWRL